MTLVSPFVFTREDEFTVDDGLALIETSMPRQIMQE